MTYGCFFVSMVMVLAYGICLSLVQGCFHNSKCNINFYHIAQFILLAYDAQATNYLIMDVITVLIPAKHGLCLIQWIFYHKTIVSQLVKPNSWKVVYIIEYEWQKCSFHRKQEEDTLHQKSFWGGEKKLLLLLVICGWQLTRKRQRHSLWTSPSSPLNRS